MPATLDIAIVGATGRVGETLVEVLEERNFPVGNLHVLASLESAGKSLPFRGKNLRVREVDAFDFSQVGLVFFAAAPATTLAFAPRARQAGCAIIDLAGALDAPAIVPEANASAFATREAISPCSPVVALAVALAPLRALLAPQRLTVTACMAVSSAGREGVQELARQTAELLNARPLEPQHFDRQVAFNLLAQVGKPDAVGHLALERRIDEQLREVLELPLLEVAATCIQVPVFFGDSLTVSLVNEGDVDIGQINQLLASAPGLELVEEAGDYPTPVGDAVGQDVVYAGRLRPALRGEREVNLWLTLDNVRKGAALNAVQIAELLIKDLA
ncbi:MULTISPECIES: aspartate-semialdehyde dehydrogenase [unclassified Pseudomonas]|uniref:aspartate-semialdehyde dehydrogenase n=1 Tax=unclassified Pseudomonas TaxID=196821 RepID=UPI000BD5E7B1|nr:MULTISPECIES: aspartate-semialdehyde dehydrogenase [unclassified Pseudomonas]PVZ16187.1 aspartate-semialdehyde dehydrogenase [Pseudomonas sp. URIL14HWK12:I12]PVZ25957.1 aspartate-semialdehyde dehydrogenase [Pseudomonas sp. URIL14HWK12:I10]PVZ36519.1 aspartate-semialdehyde dehydrogenase [Pseudomonas sp. URIL14HWK12:I11]SNZ13294.1 Aspartate-semialdehyde dehydrogenase [Pseudomonas sp. URIL14HWK12:I9]